VAGKLTTKSFEALGAMIREAGLRLTRPRVAVLQVLQKSSTPLSHGDLVDALGGEGYDRVTLFRNLNDLAEAGLVTRTDLGDRTWRFELKRGGSEHGIHPHFTCSDCGTVSCLPDDSVRIANSVRVPRAVRSQAVEVTLRGLCDRCA
jgi:Fur family ferric uptake transcriptional regulator